MKAQPEGAMWGCLTGSVRRPSRILSAMRLDEAKVDDLRRWGQALREASDERTVAAGRAILMLIQELERVRLELSRTREHLEGLYAGSNSDITEAKTGDTVALTLHERLQQATGQGSEQTVAAQPEAAKALPDVESDGNTASARSWIEMLRRQK